MRTRRYGGFARRDRERKSRTTQRLEVRRGHRPITSWPTTLTLVARRVGRRLPDDLRVIRGLGWNFPIAGSSSSYLVRARCRNLARASSKKLAQCARRGPPIDDAAGGGMAPAVRLPSYLSYLARGCARAAQDHKQSSRHVGAIRHGSETVDAKDYRT